MIKLKWLETLQSICLTTLKNIRTPQSMIIEERTLKETGIEPTALTSALKWALILSQIKMTRSLKNYLELRTQILLMILRIKQRVKMKVLVKKMKLILLLRLELLLVLIGEHMEL